MTHADIVAYLETQALAAGAASFWHGEKAQGNINYDAPFPQALLFLMPSQLKKDTITTQVAMCFIGKDEHENGSADSILIQNEMDLLSQQFYVLLNAEQEASVELVEGKMERAPVQRKGTQIGTGFLVNFQLSSLIKC